MRMAGLFARPRALDAREIEQIIQRFGRTAAVAKAAGFSGVQIHAAHGYLISQFLSPLTNRREDAWGGDADRRRRFLLEVVRAVRAAVGKHMPVGVKLNSADFQRGGFDHAESMAVIEALEAEEVELLEISGGTYESAAMFQEGVPQAASTQQREAYFLEYAEQVRERTRIPLMVTGGFRTRAGMDHALASGATDVVGLARPLALEPTLPRRLLNGTATAAVPIRLSTGIKMIDGLIHGSFYQAQIRRMGAGLEPLPSQSRLLAAVAYAAGNRPYTPVTRQLPQAAAAVAG
jgi:2,4-dienoyl-CoA reductase-like NADH-dependent reductase (Old Yellow Enzyme family)